jgi:hypothetical protein
VIAAPMRFQIVMAVLAIGGSLVLTQAQAAGRPEPHPVFAFQDAAITESSGLVADGAHVLTVNDSGAGPLVYVVDAASGRTVGRTTYTSDAVVDVEAMAPGPGHTLWVGDIGDNEAHRAFVSVYRMPMPDAGDVTVSAQRFDLVYEGGPRDAEALLVQPRTGRLYVASKGLFGGKLYAAPPRLSSDHANVLRPIADVGGLVTDGAFFPDGRFAALRSYGSLSVLDSHGWRSVQGMQLPEQDQGEGLAMSPGGRSVLVSTEGAGSDVLTVPLTRAITDRVAPAASLSASPPEEQVVSVEEELHLTPMWEVAAFAAVTLAVALGIRALFRRRRG